MRKKKWIEKVCDECGNSFSLPPGRINGAARTGQKHWYCGEKCRIIGLSKNRKRRKLSERYTTGAGYVRVRADHPRAKNAGGFVEEHRLVMEQILGRYLRPGEVVHHRNRIRDDNRPENLVVMISRLHNKEWNAEGATCPRCGITFYVQ